VKETERTEDLGRPIAGRYWIEEVLGRGGMGAVYRVRDARTERRLALKRGYARDARKTEKRKALLEREYHTLAQLAHPRIIEVYDYGVDDFGPYYTMELLDGADLDKRGRLPWREACSLLYDVASSLAILHSRGLLHRDVSARNVRCTADGRAKLLDFGAMACMGVSKDIVGTPPFVPPEVLQLQALDARADLYSLGALGYYLVTGRHAFPARRLNELRDVWRSAPSSPGRLAPELPAALGALLLQLLSLDRGTRPQSAAEVMERLCAIAGLPMEERAEVSRAYLATPTLVGREKALLGMRRRMLSLVRGEGGALLLEGAQGSGRSRLLDACVLEGKLLGAIVVRADASDAVSGDWGVAREIGGQLCELLPAEAAEAARLSRHVLAHLLDALRDGGSTVPTAPPERSLLLRELRDFVLALSRGQRLLIAVDDVDRIDEPSSALLAALADKTDKHPVMLALTSDRVGDATGTASLRLLRSVATPIEVEQLDVEQTEALLRSVFGEVDNLRLVAGRIHALSQGNPRAAMELAQHLCDRGLARYQAGSWSLPGTLDEGDLPTTLAISLAQRLMGMSRDAGELCELLALADGDPLVLLDYPALTEHGDHARVFRALDELVAARVLLADAERYRFTQRGFISVLHEAMDEPRTRALHARLADARAVRAEPLRLAHHLMAAGRDREAVELLCGLDLHELLAPLPLLESVLAASERLGMPARMTHALRTAVVIKAPMVFAAESFRRQLGPVLDQLERDSGLRLYRELAHLPEGERLPAALAGTQERHAQTPEVDRVFPIIDAVRELAKFSASFCSLAMQLIDLDFLESLPSLEPLTPLSPSLQVVARVIDGGKQALRGRTTQSAEIHEAALRRLAEPDRAGFDETYHRGIRLGLHYMLGLLDASLGSDSAEQRAQLLEADREHRVNAWRMRLAFHLNQGNAEEARKCMRRAELLQLQEGAAQRYLGTSAGFELIAQALIGDLIGVKRALDHVAELARHYPGWRAVSLLGQCHYRRLQGDLPGALEAIEAALPLAPAGRHPYYPYVAAAHVMALLGLGKVQEAVAVGRQHAETCRREQLESLDRWVYLAFAQALGKSGEFAEALEVIGAVIAGCERTRMGGLPLGAVYEARARIAIWMNDPDAFAHYTELCAAEYRKGRNPALGAKFARLMEEARQSQPSASLPPRAADVLELSQTETGHETIQSRMLECVDENDRGRCALTILLQSCDSFAGYLFAVHGESLAPLAGLPDPQAEDALARWAEACLNAEVASQLSATATADGEDDEPSSGPSIRYTDAEGRCFEPIYLVSTREDRRQRIAAVLALQISAGPRTLPSKELLTEIADALFEHGDVTGIEI
jgi:hypothetical protein